MPLLRDFGAIVALQRGHPLAAALVILPPMLVWGDTGGPGVGPTAARSAKDTWPPAVGVVAGK
ncbi:MAG: hypothetical protein IPQ14_10755 [Candidatus Microthrix sp.]|uniref:hypothetical protein n=1 Tax=Candidatus Neomicrothrix sp. TaxID=2719034 RepID=UPI0025C463EC|nr:hypothetical protein [Candidatus Microthrix sp.]MBL0204777.1 hypothetical protein [Candidatus Microthrix sp.]